MSAIIVRMTEREKETIRQAARREERSMNRFVLRAALAAANGGERTTRPDLEGEAALAFDALVQAGMGRTEAEARVRAATRLRPGMSAAEIMLACYRKEAKQ